jgi:hypothetical protein
MRANFPLVFLAVCSSTRTVLPTLLPIRVRILLLKYSIGSSGRLIHDWESECRYLTVCPSIDFIAFIHYLFYSSGFFRSALNHFPILSVFRSMFLLSWFFRCIINRARGQCVFPIDHHDLSYRFRDFERIPSWFFFEGGNPF